MVVGEVQITPDISISGWNKNILCGVICFIFLGITRGLEHILWNIIIVSLLVGSHMVLRPRSVSASADSSSSTGMFKLHGLQWASFQSGASSTANQDPENPVSTASSEEDFLNSYSSTSYLNVRKRHVV